MRVDEEGETEAEASGSGLGREGSEERDSRGEFAGFASFEKVGTGFVFDMEDG